MAAESMATTSRSANHVLSHSTGSNHYSGMAVDLDIGVGNAAQIEQIANKYGGTRNSETDHIHLDFTN